MAQIAEKRRNLDKIDLDKDPDSILMLSRDYLRRAQDQMQGYEDFLEPAVLYPWMDNWNPGSDAVQNLIHAAALIAAALDKLQTNE